MLLLLRRIQELFAEIVQFGTYLNMLCAGVVLLVGVIWEDAGSLGSCVVGGYCRS